MNKIISIDESLFNNMGSSRKKRSSNNQNGNIKIKSQTSKPKTLKRNQLLKMIREQQEKNYKRLLEGDPNIKKDTPLQEEFSSNFNDTLNYLMDLAEKEKKIEPTPSIRQTFKAPRVNENVSMEYPELNTLSNSHFSIAYSSNPMKLSQPVKQNKPSWGCLKNGNLPTFRNWKNSTQKIYPSTTEDVVDSISQSVSQEGPMSIPILQQYHEFKKQKPEINPPILTYPKQKRILRRTFKVGKYKSKPKIGVLVSNRTIRNRVSTDNQLLKQTAIEDIRKFLVKKGFIRVGSSAPNDVLRKMHETAKLMCGEIENHNPDNLVYNYLHGS